MFIERPPALPLLDERQDITVLDLLIQATANTSRQDPRGAEDGAERLRYLVSHSRRGFDPDTRDKHGFRSPVECKDAASFSRHAGHRGSSNRQEVCETRNDKSREPLDMLDDLRNIGGEAPAHCLRRNS